MFKRFLSVLLFIAVIATLITCTFSCTPTPAVDLLEEYKAITPSDNLKGYFDKDSVLHIEFNNARNGMMSVKPEYVIELLQDDMVLVKTPDTIYKCYLDEIAAVIMTDQI